MTPAEFQNLFTSTVDKLHALAAIKGGEYASESDRLANFRTAGQRLGVPPELVLLTYLDKHYAALCNFIRDQLAGRTRPRSEPIDGRVHDMMIYLILFLALLRERQAVRNAAADEGPRLVWDAEEDA